MPNNASAVTNPPQSSASASSGAKQSSPLTTGQFLQGFNKYTLGSPNGYMPDWMTGALPRALLTSGIGALAGRYGAPWLLEYLAPNLPHHHPTFQRKAKNLGTAAGGLLGLLATAPDLYTSFQAGRGQTDSGEFGPWSGGFKGLFGGSKYIPKQPVQVKKTGAFKKTGSFWHRPIVDVAPMTDATRQAIYEGRTDPVAALKASQSLAMADRDSNGFTTPGSLANSITDTVIRAGAGAAMGYAAGRVGGALGGAFGLLSKDTQAKAGPATALAGSLANVIAGSSLFK